MTNKIVKFILFSLVLILLSCQSSSPLKQDKTETVIARNEVTKQSQNVPASPIFIPKPQPYGTITIDGQKVKFNVNYYNVGVLNQDTINRVPTINQNPVGTSIYGVRSLHTLALPCNTMVKQKISVTGIGIPTPMYADGADPVTKLINGPSFPAGSCNILGTISNVSYGRRVGTVSGYTSGDMEIAGTNVKAVFDVSAPVTNVEICYRGTPSGKVVEDIIAAGKNWIATTMNLVNLQTLIDNITGKAGVAPNYTYTTHPVLVNDTNIANDLIANGGDPTLLNPLNAAYKITPGQITGTIAGLVSTDKATITINDPISAAAANNSNGAFSMAGISPGNWTVKISSTGYTVSSEPVANVTEGGTIDVGTITLTPPTPNITSLVPNAGAVGASIQINGINFHPNTDGNVVKFGAINAVVTAASTTQLTVTVPGGISGTVGVTVSVGSQTSNSVDFTVQVGTKKWEFVAGGSFGGSNPAIGSDGTIYQGSADFKLYAINPDGTQKWEFATGSTIYSSPAIGSDGTIYVGSWDNKLYALNPDGSKKWEFLTGGKIYSSPAIGGDGTIYMGSYLPDTKFYAINPDGTKKWEFVPGGNGNIGSNAAIGSNIYIGSGNTLYALNPDGTKQWEFSTGGSVQSSPAIGSDGTIYVGSNDFKLYALNPDGTKKWEFLTGGGIYWSSPTIGSDGTIYVGSYDNKLYAINPDGTKKWEFLAGNYVTSSPAIGSDGTIYVGSYDNKVYAINPNGTKQWDFLTGGQIFASSPAIATNGTVYIGSGDGKLYALSSSSAGLADSVWPKFHANNKNTGLLDALFVSNLIPGYGKAGTSVAIYGNHFIGATSVKFNGLDAVFTVDSNTKITATAPVGVTTGKISVTTPEGTVQSVKDFILDLSVPVCTAIGDSWSVNIINDPLSKVVIAWADERNGNQDIYAQRLETDGTPLWTINGISVCNEGSIQNAINIIADGNGGSIIVWLDERSGVKNIYAQKLDSNGNTLWVVNGVKLGTNNDTNYPPDIISDEAGGAIVTWFGTGNSSDIYAQRIDSNGNLLWGLSGVTVCGATKGQFYVQMISDGAGGAILTWHDERSGGTVQDIYAQRIDSNGTALWTANGVIICVVTKAQMYPTIASDGSGGAFITWNDQRNNEYDIYAQRIDNTGVVKWTANGIVVNNTANDNVSTQKIINNGNNDAIIVWSDKRNLTDYNLYAQKFDINGIAQWTANGIEVSTANNNQIYQAFPPMYPDAVHFNIIKDSNGGAIIVWCDERNLSTSNLDIYAQRIDTNGNLLWSGNPIVNTPINIIENPQKFPHIAGNGTDFYITWHDSRTQATTLQDIYMQIIDINGVLK